MRLRLWRWSEFVDWTNGLGTPSERAARAEERAARAEAVRSRVLRGAPLLPGLGLGPVRFGMTCAEIGALPGFTAEPDEDGEMAVLTEENASETLAWFEDGRLVMLSSREPQWLEAPDGPQLFPGKMDKVGRLMSALGLEATEGKEGHREAFGITTFGGCLAVHDHLWNVEEVAWWDPKRKDVELPFYGA